MADERDKGDDSTRFVPGRGADDETRFTGVGAPGAAAEPQATFPRGSVIGHTYRIDAFLARGGMGEVYRARHVELNTDHALKIILPELANNQRSVDLFRREAAVLRTIRHDAVVAYDGVFRDENGRLYLVMEFADGPSLSKQMRERPLGADEVRRLRDRLADGLAVAHEKGVIHRDISPDNVILPGGDLGRAKIIDFGISKMADPEAKTIVGDDFAGKFSYVSPEQLGMFGGQVDGRSDIYSLGLVLAAAAIGEPLDMGVSPIAVIEARRAVPDLGRVPAAVRAELAAMLQPDPADRPQSMGDLVRSQEQRGGRRSTLSEPSGRSSGKPRSGRMGGLVGALAVLVVAGGVGGYWLWQNRSPHDDTAQTTQQSDSSAQQNGSTAASNTGMADTGSTTGQAMQQSTPTGAGQTQSTTAGTSVQDMGAEATATQQQTSTGTTSSPGADTATDSQQGSALNSATSPASESESSATAQNTTTVTTAGNTDSQSQSQQINGPTSVAATESGQTSNGTSGPATIGEQQTLTGSQSNDAGTAGEQQSTSPVASNDALSSENNAATGAGASNVTSTSPKDTQTVLLPQVPDVAKLRSDAERAVQGLSCANVRVDVSDAGDITASGYVASKADRDKAAARLASVPDVGRVDNALVVMARPLCDVLDVLRTSTSLGQGLPMLDPGGVAAVYREGDHIRVTVTAPPGFNGYLYVDYIDAAERYVIHLLPNEKFRRDNRVAGGQQIVIGSLPEEYDTYKIQPPFGANLIIAIASRKPLFPSTREIQESVDQYLPALRNGLAAQAASDLASQYAGVLLQAR